MAEKTTVNYDQLRILVKKFNVEGEGIAQLNAKLREIVHAMHNEWIGAGSEAFFDEMEMEILPSVKRLEDALLFSGKALMDISKIYQNAEQDSSNVFKGDFENMQYDTTDFGAGKFDDLGGITGSPSTGTTPGSEPDLNQTDYGAGQFDNIGGDSGSGEVDGASQFDQGGGSESGAAGEAGGNKEGSAGLNSSGSAGGASGSGGADSGGDSGGGGGGSGDLNEMGSGIKHEGSAGGSGSGTGSGGSSGAGADPMQDHVYQSASGGVPGTGDSGGSGAASSGRGAGPVEGGSTVNSAAGVAGIAGGAAAAAGGVAKVIKDKQEEE